MSHGIRRLPQIKVPVFARRSMRRIKPWCERIALLIAVTLAYTRLRAEIGNWQALLATAGAPLAVLDGPWNGRFVAHRVRQRLRRPVRARPHPVSDVEPPVTLWISSTSQGHHIVISTRAGGLVAAPTRLTQAGGTPVPPYGVPVTGPDREPEAADSAEPAVAMPPIGRSQHCVLFAVDIAQFTDARRDDEVQLALRDALYRLLIDSFECSGIAWASCVHEDRGDGVVVVVPAHMPTITIVDPLIDQIRTRLRRHNRLSSPVAQVRLRLAAHIGEVYRDGHGLAGKAVNHLFRMLDAPDLRHVLQSSETELALIVSDYLYDSVIRGGPNGVDPAAYCAVTVQVKQFRARAWLLGVPGTG
jgi:hypothetical protein